MLRHRPFVRPALLMLLTALAAPAAGSNDRHDHELAREALAAGQILPLRTVLERVRRDYPGEALEVELEEKSGRWVYKVKMLRPDGGVSKLLLDARDASLLGVGGHGQRSREKD
ncbi:MAG TPA: PepSY domain-containing protein [Azonexus sp.]